MRLYWEVARRGFRRFATYRGATIGGLITNTVFGFLRAYILIALYRQRPAVGGWDQTDAITYVWLTQSILMMVAMWGWDELGVRVRTGNLAVDLARPVDLQLSLLATDLGRATYHLLARGGLPLVTGMVFFDLRLPRHPVVWVSFVVSMFLAVLVSFGLRFIVNSAAFWLVDTRGVTMVYGLGVNLLSGFIVPTVLFPAWFAEAARYLPFAAVVQFPIEVFLGKHGTVPVAMFAVQLGWGIALFLVGRAILRAGTTRLVIQGG